MVYSWIEEGIGEGWHIFCSLPVLSGIHLSKQKACVKFLSKAWFCLKSFYAPNSHVMDGSQRDPEVSVYFASHPKWTESSIPPNLLWLVGRHGRKHHSVQGRVNTDPSVGCSSTCANLSSSILLELFQLPLQSSFQFGTLSARELWGFFQLQICTHFTHPYIFHKMSVLHSPNVYF